MSTAAPAPAAPKTDRKLTSYRVLKFPEPQSPNSASTNIAGIKEVGHIAAVNANAAIRRVADKEGAGTYVAVPASSWKPQKVTVEQTTVVTVGDA